IVLILFSHKKPSTEISNGRNDYSSNLHLSSHYKEVIKYQDRRSLRKKNRFEKELIYHDIKIRGLQTLEEFQGYGEMGSAVELRRLSPEQLAVRENLFKKHYLDAYVSNLISLKRSLPDVRREGCKTNDYLTQELPRVSVIICFHNEASSVLLRT